MKKIPTICKKVNFIAQTEVSLARGSQGAKEWIFITEAGSQQVAFVDSIAVSLFTNSETAAVTP